MVRNIYFLLGMDIYSLLGMFKSKGGYGMYTFVDSIN